MAAPPLQIADFGRMAAPGLQLHTGEVFANLIANVIAANIFLNCKPLDNLDHGSFSLSNRKKHNSVATFSCDEGFQLLGDVTRTCNNGTWENLQPSCARLIEECSFASSENFCGIEDRGNGWYDSSRITGDHDRYLFMDYEYNNYYGDRDMSMILPVSNVNDYSGKACISVNYWLDHQTTVKVYTTSMGPDQIKEVTLNSCGRRGEQMVTMIDIELEKDDKIHFEALKDYYVFDEYRSKSSFSFSGYTVTEGRCPEWPNDMRSAKKMRRRDGSTVIFQCGFSSKCDVSYQNSPGGNVRLNVQETSLEFETNSRMKGQYAGIVTPRLNTPYWSDGVACLIVDYMLARDIELVVFSTSMGVQNAKRQKLFVCEAENPPGKMISLGIQLYLEKNDTVTLNTVVPYMRKEQRYDITSFKLHNFNLTSGECENGDEFESFELEGNRIGVGKK